MRRPDQVAFLDRLLTMVRANTREACLPPVSHSLELTVHGIETSRDFHLRVMEDEEFRRGAIEIQWLERRLPMLVATIPPDDGVRAAAIAAALLAYRDRTGRVTAAADGRAPESSGGTGNSPAGTIRPDAWKQAARRESVTDRW